ncbi:hypothetical protein IWX90DRAFT_419305 [Phyllosticta citrichinensis]|uniref:Uncharacterized protein n=1 Tax=Phyllosticta citrichinensis TaxID=1130410 RepID=A0ABR1XF75_9PEZI
MRFDILFIASLLPASALAGEALGYAARKKLIASGKSAPASVSLMSTGGGEDDQGNPVSPDGRSNDRAGRRIPGNDRAKNLCGSSDFKPVPIPDDNSVKPTVDDALMLAKIVGQGSQRYTVTPDGSELVRYKSGNVSLSYSNVHQLILPVAFFGRSKRKKAGFGNEDVANLIEDSANLYSQSGYVSVQGGYVQLVNEKGLMACDDDNPYNGIQAVDVEWRIGPPSDRYPSDGSDPSVGDSKKAADPPKTPKPKSKGKGSDTGPGSKI